MSTLARRALTNAIRMIEDEARRRRHLLFGGYPEVQQEADFIREHLEQLVAAVPEKPKTESQA